VDVLHELTTKLVGSRLFAFKRFIGHGCGKLRRKCSSWAANLVARGCTHIVVLHDRDTWEIADLKRLLETEVRKGTRRASVVLIPVEEIEAWLLTDADAIRIVFRMKSTPRIRAATEKINDPKEFLERLVARNSKSHYLNTVHNQKIAAAMKVKNLSRCPSFGPYPKFVASALKGK